MSKIFSCGEDGCDVEFVDDKIMSRAQELRIQWAIQEKKKIGEYPDGNVQAEYVQRVYEMLVKIRAKQIKCPTCSDTGKIRDYGDNLGGVCGAVFELMEIYRPCPDCTQEQEDE